MNSVAFYYPQILTLGSRGIVRKKLVVLGINQNVMSPLVQVIQNKMLYTLLDACLVHQT